MAEDSNNNFFGENDLLKYQFMFEELYKFMGHDVVVKNGLVKRLFLEEKFNEMAFEFESGHCEYVIDVDIVYSVCFMAAFINEYPEEYEKFMKIFENSDEGDSLLLTREDIDVLIAMINDRGN